MLSLTPEVMAEINTGHAPFEITLQAFSADGYEWRRNLVSDYYQLVDMSTQPIIPAESLEWFEVQGDEWGRNLLKNSDREKTGFGEYVMYTNLAPLFDEYGIGTYTFSFDLKSEIAGTITVYPTDRAASDVKYGWSPERSEIPATTEYQRYSITVDISLLTESADHCSLAFYGTYDSGRIPSVKNVKIEKGSQATPWAPAPEDFANFKGKEYHLSTPLVQNDWYTLTVQGSFSPDAFVGVWAGDGFVGYLQDGKVTLRLTKDVDIDNLIIKSSDEQGEISKVQLEKDPIPVVLPEEPTANSLRIKWAAFNGNNFRLGGVQAATLDFELPNEHRQFEATQLKGLWLEASVSLANTSFPLGRFEIIDAPTNMTYIPVKAVDAMTKFEMSANDLPIPKSISLNGLAALIADKAGVAYNPTGFHGANTIFAPEDVSDMSLRELLAEIAVLAFGFARINREGHLEIVSFPSTLDAPGLTLTEAQRSSLDIELTPHTFTRVTYEDGETKLHQGVDGLDLVLQPGVLTRNDPELALSTVAAKAIGYKFHSAQMDVLTNPTLELGDKLSIRRFEVEYPCIVSELEFTTAVFSPLRCGGLPSSTIAPSGEQELTRVRSTVARAVSQIRRHEESQRQLHALTANSLGLYETAEVLDDGSSIVYMHDAPDLDSSTVIWKRTRDAFTVSRDGGETYTEGMTADGNAVLNTLSVNGVNAEWIVVDGGTEIREDSLLRYLEQEYATISGMGAEFARQLTVTTPDGEDKLVTAYVLDLGADQIEISSTLQQQADKIDQLALKADDSSGGNMVVNSSFGTATDPSSAFFASGVVYRAMMKRSGTWAALNTTTWGELKRGER